MYRTLIVFFGQSTEPVPVQNASWFSPLAKASILLKEILRRFVLLIFDLRLTLKDKAIMMQTPSRIKYFFIFLIFQINTKVAHRIEKVGYRYSFNSYSILLRSIISLIIYCDCINSMPIFSK